jgi:exonuclease SbcC
MPSLLETSIVTLPAVETYFRRVLPNCDLTILGDIESPLLIVKTGKLSAGIAVASTTTPELTYRATYTAYKEHFLRTEGQLVDPAYILLIPPETNGDIENLCSTIETDVYFCRKFVIPVRDSLELSLARLPFLPLTPIGGASLRPASAQTFLQSRGVSAQLAKSLVTPHDRGPEKTIDDAMRGVFGPLSLSTDATKDDRESSDIHQDDAVIDSILIQGIRAYKKPQSFKLGSAITILYGPNGFGKTSFFDAIDFAITGGLGRLNALTESQMDKVIPHLDSDPSESMVSLAFRRNDEPGVITRNASDRKWAKLNGARSDRKAVLATLTKGAGQSTDRVEHLISLFRATHLFNQESQEIASDFRHDCELDASIVSRLLAFEDYNNAVNKLERVNKFVDERLDVLSDQVSAANSEISRSRAEIERTEQSLRTVASPAALDGEFSQLRIALAAAPVELTLISEDVDGLKTLRGAIDVRIAEIDGRILRLNNSVGDVSSLPKLKEELRESTAQLNDLRKAHTDLSAQRLPNETEVARAEQVLQNYRSEIAALTAQLAQLTWISEVAPRRTHANAEISRLQTVRAALADQIAELRKTDSALRESIATSEDSVGTLNERVAESGEQERLLKAFGDKIVGLHTQVGRLQDSDRQLVALTEAKTGAATALKLIREQMRSLETEVGELSEAIRRADEHNAEVRQLLALLEGHAEGSECPLCGQGYDSHDELIAKIKENTAADPLAVIRTRLAEKRAAQLETTSRYDAAQRIFQTSDAQLSEATRLNSSLKGLLDELAVAGSELGFVINSPAFSPESVQHVLQDASKAVAEASEKARAQKQLLEQAKASLSSAESALKRRQEEATRTEQLIARQRAEIAKLQTDERYVESLILLTEHVRAEQRGILEETLNAANINQAAAETDIARRRQNLAEIVRRQTALNAQGQQVSKRELDLRNALATAIQRLSGAGLGEDTTNDELLSAVAVTSKIQSDLTILKERAVGLEVGLDAAASVAILEQHRSTISTNDTKVKRLRPQQRKLRDAAKYFEAIYGLVSGQQNAAIDRFTKEYGPRTSVIQRRLRSVYTFEDVEISADDGKIAVNVRRNGKELRPVDFFSQSQIQTLLLGLFLTASTAQTWSSFSTVFLDDPVTHFDDLNTYALLDLISGLLDGSDGAKQFIISTCDDRFLELARQKFRTFGDRAKFYEFSAIGSDGPVVAELV